MRTTKMCITRVIIVSLTVVCLGCERCYKWLCVKCQKVPKAMINALNKYEHLHWYCMSCEVAATKAAAESNMKCRKIKLAETSPDIKTIAEVAQKTADAILNEVQVKLNVQASPDESTKRSYSDVARNISRFTGTINKMVSNTTRSQNIDQNTVAEKRKWWNWSMNTWSGKKEGKM